MKKVTNGFFYWICFFVLSFFAPSSNAFAAQTLYAVDKVSNLYTVNPSTGDTTLVGPLGVDRVSSMAFDPVTGTLYAGIGFLSEGCGCVFTVNTATGAATLVGCDSVPSGCAITDMDFRPDGTLFGYYDQKDGLATINPATGGATFLGFTGFSTFGNGIAFDSCDTILYHASDDGLFTLNQDTGEGTFITLFNYIGFPPLSDPRINSLSFDQHRVLYGILNDGSEGSGPSYLVTIDISTGDVTNIGQTLNGLDGLAWSLPEIETCCTNRIDDDGDGFIDCVDSDCVGDPACPTIPIPALMPLGTIVMSILITLYGIRGLRRRVN